MDVIRCFIEVTMEQIKHVEDSLIKIREDMTNQLKNIMTHEERIQKLESMIADKEDKEIE